MSLYGGYFGLRFGVDPSGLSVWIPIRPKEYPSDTLEPNKESSGTGPMMYNSTTGVMVFKEPSESECEHLANIFYGQMKRFSFLRDNSIANVKLFKGGNYAKFKLKNWFINRASSDSAGAGNDEWFKVKLTFSDATRKVSARTVGNHPLVGTRHFQTTYNWNGKTNCCTITVKTWALAHARGWQNYWGMVFGGEADVQQQWHEYIQSALDEGEDQGAIIIEGPTDDPER